LEKFERERNREGVKIQKSSEIATDSDAWKNFEGEGEWLRKRDSYLYRGKDDDIEKECPEIPDSSSDTEQKRQRVREIHKSESKYCGGGSWNL